MGFCSWIGSSFIVYGWTRGGLALVFLQGVTGSVHMSASQRQVSIQR